MKAIIQNKYGDASTLQLVDVPPLTIQQPTDVLIDVHVANIWKAMKRTYAYGASWKSM